MTYTGFFLLSLLITSSSPSLVKLREYFQNRGNFSHSVAEKIENLEKMADALLAGASRLTPSISIIASAKKRSRKKCRR